MKTREIIVLSRHQAFLRTGGSRTFSSHSITPVVRRHQRTKYFTHMWNIYIILYDIQICAGLFIRQSQRAHTCNRTSIAELRCAKMTSIVGENIQTVHILNPRSNVESKRVHKRPSLCHLALKSTFDWVNYLNTKYYEFTSIFINMI